MNEVESALRQVVSDLLAEKVPFALVGGLGVSVRAEPRLTRDVDLAVAVDDDQMAESIVRSLVGRGYTPDLVQEHASGRLATVRLSKGQVVADLLFASSGIETEIVENAERLEVLAGFTIPVATIGHLIALKLLARDDRSRPADADDLRALAIVAGKRDWAQARTAVALIRERGYERGRDLAAALAEIHVGRKARQHGEPSGSS